MDSLTGQGTEARIRELEARLVLEGLPGVGAATQRRLLERWGSAEAAVRRGIAALPGTVGAKAQAAARDPARWMQARHALARAEASGMEASMPGDEGYPSRLLRLTHPPGILFLRGRRDLVASPGVAIVGSRKATARGREVARRLGGAVARVGIPVVSGLAFGVDAAAHTGALDVGGPTVAVLGRGADRPYPTAHAALFGRVLRDGLVVTEFPPGTPPLAHHFPRRNRIIAALARCVVVVEAGARSGALITVEHALDVGLDVWAVPGPFDEAFCLGSNRLLRDGARALVSVEDFVRQVSGGEEVAPACRGPEPEPEQSRLLSCLSGGARSVDDLARMSQLEVARVLAVLTEMELLGWVVRSPGMRFRKAG